MNKKTKKILITGGAGFVGLHLARELLLRKKGRVIILDNFFRGPKDQDLRNLMLKFPKTLELVETDLSRPDFPQIPADQIYHLAAINGTRYFYERPQEIIRANILASINILDRYKDSGAKIVYSSSCETYAALPASLNGIPTPETCAVGFTNIGNPRWSYGFSKLAGEFLLINYAKKFPIKYSIVRLHNIYGPRMGYEHVISGFFKRILDREKPFRVKNSNDTRSFCYVSDCVKGLIAVMDSNKANGEIFNIGNPVEIKIGDLARRMLQLFAGWRGKELDQNIILGEKEDVGSADRRCPDITKIKTALGYRNRVMLDEGLQKTFDWYKKHYGQKTT